VYAHLLRVSPRRLARVPVGDLVSRLDGDIAEVQRFGTDAAASFISSVLTLVVVGAVMLGLSWRLTLLVVAMLPLQLVVRQYARPRIEASTRALREAAARLSGFLVETLSGARSVQAAAAEEVEGRRLDALGAAYLGRVLRQQLVTYSTGSLAGFLGHVATAATFVLGGWYVLQGHLSVGTLVAFVAYLGRSAGSAASMAALYTGESDAGGGTIGSALCAGMCAGDCGAGGCARRATLRIGERGGVHRGSAGIGRGLGGYSCGQQSCAAGCVRRWQVDLGGFAASVRGSGFGSDSIRWSAARGLSVGGSAPAHCGGRTFTGVVSWFHSG
jgi:hypothetical protein